MKNHHLPGVIEQKGEASHGEVAKGVVVLADSSCHHPEVGKNEDKLKSAKSIRSAKSEKV